MRIFLLFVWTIVVISCNTQHAHEADNTSFQLTLPRAFDSLPFIPEANLLTERRVRLGKMLFNDPRLSGDGKISCASCHIAAFAFADTVAVSIGVHGKRDRRNAPSLLNVAYQKRLFMEGGVPNLEVQVLAPFGNENEMAFTLTDAAKILRHDDEIADLAREAYDREVDGYVISRALAAYERSLISNGSPYDDYLAGDASALSAAAKRGKDIFFSAETKCATCHNGFLFTDQSYYNIGLYEKYDDEGRGRLTLDSNDLGKIKTPTLRNVAITAPYMHDGSIATLGAVIAHFNAGGANHPNKSNLIRPLGLSQDEQNDLLAFLQALTDTKPGN